jgi:hypothetical protein
MRRRHLYQSMQRAFRTPPGLLARKVLRRAQRTVRQSTQRRRDAIRPSFSVRRCEPALETYLHVLPREALAPVTVPLAGVCEHYLAHRFDLLGSGWVRVAHGRRCQGVEGHVYQSPGPEFIDADGLWLAGRINAANFREAQRIWKMISPGYAPIDWQLDFKSGYRWHEGTWYRDIAIPSDHQGADIKVPWEVARCQHLPQMAIAHMMARADFAGFRPPDSYRREFCDEVLDFIATNPPRFGVNWSCTMDVAIRVANWLIACDLFRAGGVIFPQEFVAVFARSVREHGEHIASNLEWVEQGRSNHYLANIVGLMFAAAYLPPDAQSNAWAGFAIGELVREVGQQFYEDGANFEGSTNYHRLSAEMAIYGTALALSLIERRGSMLEQVERRFIFSAVPHQPAPSTYMPGPKAGRVFPDGYAERLEKMGEFTMHSTRGDRAIVQIGDNDSGRFFKLQPIYTKMTKAEAVRRYASLEHPDEMAAEDTYWDEDVLDHRHLLGALSAFFDREDFGEFAGAPSIDRMVIADFSGGVRFQSRRVQGPSGDCAQNRIGGANGLKQIKAKLEAAVPDTHRCVYRFALPVGSLANLETLAYPAFGLYVMRSSGVFLAVSCRPGPQKGSGSHLHNDQLAVELIIGGQAVAIDPGTYVYTPLPDRRQAYRSIGAHFAPRVAGREPADLSAGLFVLRDDTAATCLHFGKDGFAGMHLGFGKPIYRLIEVSDRDIVIRDYSEGEPLEPCAFANVNQPLPRHVSPPMSPKYGCRLRSIEMPT